MVSCSSDIANSLVSLQVQCIRDRKEDSKVQDKERSLKKAAAEGEETAGSGRDYAPLT